MFHKSKFQGVVEAEGTFGQLQNSDTIYAKLLTKEEEPTEEDKYKVADATKISRQMSTRVSFKYNFFNSLLTITLLKHIVIKTV